MAESSKLEPGMKEAVEAVQAVAHMPPEMARNYLEMLGHVATKFMRANSFGGYNVEIKHDISWARGHRVRLLVEGT